MRRLSKRQFLVAAAAGLVAPNFSAAAPSSPTRASAPVELRMSWWGGSDIHKVQLAALRRFESRYPGIRVRAEYTGWAGHLERLTTQISGNTAPDLMQINWNWLVLFSRDGLGFYDLRELAGELDLAQFDTDSLAFGTMAGRLNGLPISMASRLFYYNASTYERAGLPLPSTWEELFAAGPIFRSRLGPEYYPLDLNLQDVTAVGRTWLLQRTGKPLVDEQGRKLNASEGDLQEIAGFYRRLVEEHVVPSVQERASYGNVAPHEMRSWINGRYAGVHQWITAIGKSADTLAPGQRIELGAFPLRSGAVDAGLLYRPGMLLAINARTQHPREAALLIRFLLEDEEAVRAMGLRRGPPVNARALRRLADDGTLTGISWQGREQVRALPNQIRESGFYDHPRVRDAFMDAFELLGYQRMGVPAAGSRMYEDVNQILRRVIRS
jgi:oligogalacturonide transport system substrate-binding protein